MKTMYTVLAVTAAAFILSLPVVAQGRGFGPRFGNGFGPWGGGFAHNPERVLQHLGTVLDLTEAQKQQAKSIFEASKKSAEPIAEQMKQNREAIEAAVKSNKSDAELNALTTQTGTLVGQIAGIHTKGMRDFYNLLTPEQREKADKLHSQMKDRAGKWRQRFSKPAA